MNSLITKCVQIIILVFIANSLYANENTTSDQPLLHEALNYLVGNWHLTKTENGDKAPDIIMKTTTTEDGRGIIITLKEKNEKDEWEVILVEYMVYERNTNNIHVLWNNRGDIGKGVAQYNAKKRQLFATDTNMKNELVFSVLFEFLTDNKFLISGFEPPNKKVWGFIYEKE